MAARAWRSRGSRALGARRRSWPGAPVAAALGASLVCSFYIQLCWGSTSAEPAGIQAERAMSPIVESHPTGMTTGFYEADIQGGSPRTDCAPATLPKVRPDASFDALFDNQSGPGWLGGDATFSTALPNGKESFVFGDTLAGTAAPDGQITNFEGLVHDSELIGTMPDLKADFEGTASAPTSTFPDTENPGDGFQIGSTYMENGQQLVFVQELIPVPGTIYGTYTGRSAIAIMSLASGTPTLSSVDDIPTDRWTQWGNALVQSGGYDYIYGIDFNTDAGIWYGLKVARVPVGNTLDFSQWSYWNGASWVSGESNAVVTGTPLVNGIISLEGASGFMGVGVGGSGSNYYVYLTFSCSPTGPWSPTANVYTIPQTATYSNEIAYMATFHPELGGDGLVASYNVDSSDGLSSLEQDDHEYQPGFIDIGSGTDVDAPVSAPEVPVALYLPLAAMAVCGGAAYTSNTIASDVDERRPRPRTWVNPRWWESVASASRGGGWTVDCGLLRYRITCRASSSMRKCRRLQCPEALLGPDVGHENQVPGKALAIPATVAAQRGKLMSQTRSPMPSPQCRPSPTGRWSDLVVTMDFLEPSSLALTGKNDLLEEKLDRGRNRNGNQCADDSQERGADQRGDDGQPRRHLHGVLHHTRIQEVILQEPVGDVEAGGCDPDGKTFGECD